MKKKEIILINPNSSGTYRSAKKISESLSLGLLAACIERQGFSTIICDARFFMYTPEDAVNQIANFSSPLIIGFTMISAESINWVFDFIKTYKYKFKEDVHFSVGGYFPTLQYNKIFETIPNVNSVIIGEGELTFNDLINSLHEEKDWHSIEGIAFRDQNNKIVINKRRKLISNLDLLPFPKRYISTLADENFEVLIEGSRGCISHCTFCAIKPFYQANPSMAWRTRSPLNIMQELKAIKANNIKINKFRFADPDFLGPKGVGQERALDLAKMIQAELPGIEFHIEARVNSIKDNRIVLAELKKSGLKSIHIGIESGNQHVLNQMAKNVKLKDIHEIVKLLHELEIHFAYGFMMFTPWTEVQDIEENLNFMKEIGSVQMYKLFNEMDLIPGTPSINQALKIGHIYPKKNSGYYTYKSKYPIINILRSLWVDLSTNHIGFIEDLWYLYKDTQRSIQEKTENARVMEQLVDCFFLDIFKFCYEEVNKSIECGEINTTIIANNCIQKFRPELKGLLNKNLIGAKYPRIENIRKSIIEK